MKKKSITNRAHSVKRIEAIDEGTKFLGRLVTKDGTYHVIKNDKVLIVRRGKVIKPI